MKYLNPQLEKLEQRIAPDLINIGIGVGIDYGDGSGTHESHHHSSQLGAIAAVAKKAVGKSPAAFLVMRIAR